MITDSVRRGLAAGLVAGLLAGAFALLVGEVPLREAIALEEQSHAAAHGSAEAAHDHGDAFTVSRTAQQVLLPVGTALLGAACGGLLGLVFAFVARRSRDRWRSALAFGTASWAAVALFPGLKYPSNPPGVGDPSTVEARTTWFFVAIGGSVALALLLWAASRWLRGRGTADVPRQMLVGAAAVLVYGALFFALPANTDPVEVPADLLWDFRLASMGTQAILWLGLAVAFGWLWHRAGNQEAV
ncbi:CbtA family protein [Glycomyces sp. TRM65418]|uniref:CbtA family protein n=1 Tax=Glycomyces sp. TRM65418 TaxID=2867006 RepID=UPI001CE4CEB7|nr:CbtA family protein [Glycomyces sp. TRM65418]MCC3764555.1 CbtA family protein [Glycomyces sp. TRM65418]QZD54222.1 CbtA family protein [Glycomyces sp. TRM65418]